MLRRGTVGLAIAVLIAGTFGWMGGATAPMGYDLDVSEASRARPVFLVGGPAGDLGPEGKLTIRGGKKQFEMDWTTATGAAVHISERLVGRSILFGGDPTADEVVTIAATRARWMETTAQDGRVNVLRATIGRITVSIEGPLSYEDLFQIAKSLRPGYGSLL